MMYAVLSLGLALLGGIVRLAQVLRLSAPLLYGALVITVFRPWYLAHTALADGIFLVLVGLAALSWVVTLIRAVRETLGQSAVIGFGHIAEPGFCTHFPAMLPRSSRPQAAWGTGDYHSKRVCHTNAMLASMPPPMATRPSAQTCMPPLVKAPE